MLVLFILSNRQEVTVEFLFLDFTTPQWVVLAVTALLGAAVGAGIVRPAPKRKAAPRADQALGGIQWPEFTGNAVPVTHFASGEAKNTTAPAISDECGR